MQSSIKPALVLLAATLVVSVAAGAYASGPAQASVYGGTTLQQATIEGSDPSGWPSEITIAASGSYEWENMDAYDAEVGVYVGDAEVVDDRDYRIAYEQYSFDATNATGGQATFSNVSGDVFDVATQTGYDPRYFAQDFDGESKETTIPVTVHVRVCEFDLEHGGECAEFTETHDVTVIVHNEPSDNGGAETPTETGGDTEGPPRVEGSTEVSGNVAFTDESTERADVGHTPPTPADTPVGCAESC